MKKLLSVSIISLLFSASYSALAENRNSQSGELILEDTSSVKKSSYKVSQDKAIDWIKAVKGGSEPGVLDEGSMRHLAASYLLCVSKKGTCTFMLDAILEGDVKKSKISGQAECPSLTQFWKIWVREDFEKRSTYLTPVGSVNELMKFNKEERPKYIKCKEKISAALNGGGNSKAIDTTLNYLEDIKDKDVNVLSSIGLGSGETEGEKKKYSR